MSRAGTLLLGLARLGLATLGMTTLGSPVHAEQPAGFGALSRGVGVHRLLNWARVDPGAPDTYAWPPFGDADHAVPDSLIGQVRRAGFRFVRLTVDPGPFLQFEGERRDGLDRMLLDAVRRFRAHDLGVIVNLHSNSHVARFEPEAILTDPAAPIFGAYTAVVARTARVLGGLHDRDVALEPVNEPPAGYDDATAARWQTTMEILYGAARRQAPDLLIVVTGAQGGNREALERLDPTPFRDALFSFHDYEPHLLTHQGVEAPGTPFAFRRYLRDLPYPATGSPRAVIRALQRRLEDDRLSGAETAGLEAAAHDAVTAYFAEGWKRASVESAFDGVTAWASAHAVDPHRIILGEFGATRLDPVSDRSRAAWLLDVRCAAERRHFAWSVWELSGTGGMAIADADGLDPATLGALGLTASGPGRGCP